MFKLLVVSLVLHKVIVYKCIIEVCLHKGVAILNYVSMVCCRLKRSSASRCQSCLQSWYCIWNDSCSIKLEDHRSWAKKSATPSSWKYQKVCLCLCGIFRLIVVYYIIWVWSYLFRISLYLFLFNCSNDIIVIMCLKLKCLGHSILCGGWL